MNPSLRQFELQTWLAPLGVRFCDELSGRVISNGLKVVAYPERQNSPATPSMTAFTNRAGVYVWRNLPGLGDFERGKDDERFLANAPLPSRAFTIEATDSLGRFQPCSFSAAVPFRGLFAWTCEQPLSPAAPTNTMVPLFSAPTRLVAGGLSVVRALLWDATANQPAAWAVLEASIDGRRVARGFADSLGQVALFFPSPAPGRPGFDTAGQPLPSGTSTTLAEQVWTVELQARYSPSQPLPRIPDLCATLKQAPAKLWSDATYTQQLLSVTLRFGQELVVRSQNALPESVLLISPAA